MRILKGRKPTVRDKIQSFHLNQYWGMGLLLLCVPLLPQEIPQFHTFFKSRYWLLGDVLLIWAIGTLFEHRLYTAVAQDTEERKLGMDALNVSTLLFFATPILFLLNCAGTVHLFAMQYAWAGELATGMDARFQCAAVMIGFALYVYGRFLPAVPFGSLWGISSPAARKSAHSWNKEHSRYAKRMVTGGALLLIPGLFLSGISSLSICIAGATALILSCFLSSTNNNRI